MQQPLFQLAQRVLRAAAAVFVFIGGLIGQQLAERSIHPLPCGIQVADRVGLAPGIKVRLGADDLIQQRLRLRIFNRVAVEETQPTVQPMLQRITLRILRQDLQPGQQPANFSQPTRFADKALVGAFRRREARRNLITAGAHIVLPEQIFFGAVNVEVVLIQLIEVIECLLHNHPFGQYA